MAVKTPIKLGNIAVLGRPRFEDNMICTVVNVGDPRNSLVSSIIGGVTIVLTNEDSNQMLNISDVSIEAFHGNLTNLKNDLPSCFLYLHKLENSTIDSILYDSDDFNERDSIICYSSSPSVTEALAKLVDNHNIQYENAKVSKHELSNQLGNTLDSLVDSISFRSKSESESNSEQKIMVKI